MSDRDRPVPGEATVRLMSELMSDIARLTFAVDERQPDEVRRYGRTIHERADRLADELRQAETGEP